MIYKCRNCGANAVYSPEKGTMYCPYCDSQDSEELAPGGGMAVCMNCGGELKPGDYMSAVKCEHCGTYVIFEERTEGSYKPHVILPFKLGKKEVQEKIRARYAKSAFIPADFLSDAKLSEIEGMYIPFFLYDFDCHYDIRATGSKIRTWRSGNYEYTETSLYQVERDATIDFEKLPVDASIAMPDEAMDLIEPYDYKALEDFQTKYMSGFFAEKYNMDATELGPRAKDKAKADAKAIMNKTITGYSTITNRTDNVTMDEKKADYALLPVWCYSYKYKGKDYLFKMNGQTGKIVGKPPVSWERVFGYGATIFGCTSAILTMIMLLAEVL